MQLGASQVKQGTPPFRRDEDDEGIINIIKEQKKEDVVFPLLLVLTKLFISTIRRRSVHRQTLDSPIAQLVRAPH